MVLQRRYPSRGLRQVGQGQRLLWKLGRAAETHVRETLKYAFPSQAYGVWQCGCEQSTYEGTWLEAVEKDVCHVCGWRLCKYQEMCFQDDERKIVGSPDLLLSLSAGFVPVECKSANAKSFVKIQKRPESDHVLQNLGYVRLGERSGYRMAGFGIVIYVAKEYKWGEVPYREHVVTERRYRLSGTLDLLDRTAEMVVLYSERGSGFPDRLRYCMGGPDSSRAKKCSACALCFSV